jgi:hypothetical protein
MPANNSPLTSQEVHDLLKEEYLGIQELTQSFDDKAMTVKAWRNSGSSLQSTVKKRQAHIHPVVDIGVVVVEFFVGVTNVRCREPLRQDA